MSRDARHDELQHRFATATRPAKSVQPMTPYGALAQGHWPL
jgi:hypothetical protein